VKFLSSILMLSLLTSCFGLFDKKSDTSKIKIDPSSYGSDDTTANTNTATVAATQRVAAGDISVILIDQKTVEKYGSQIVPRSDLAKAIDLLNDNYGISIGFITYLFGSERDAAGDQALADSLSASGKFFIAGYTIGEEGEASNVDQAWRMEDNDGSVKEVSRVAIPVAKFATKGLGVGVVDQTDEKNLIKLLVGHDGSLIPGAPLKIAEAFLNEKAQFYKGYLSIGGKSVKVNSEGGFDYNLNDKGTFNSYSLIDVINGSVDTSELAGDIVILGVAPANTEDISISENIASAVYNLLNQ